MNWNKKIDIKNGVCRWIGKWIGTYEILIEKMKWIEKYQKFRNHCKHWGKIRSNSFMYSHCNVEHVVSGSFLVRQGFDMSAGKLELGCNSKSFGYYHLTLIETVGWVGRKKIYCAWLSHVLCSRWHVFDGFKDRFTC